MSFTGLIAIELVAAILLIVSAVAGWYVGGLVVGAF